MNGNDLLAYSQMRQHQMELLREAQGLHLARSVTTARRLAAGRATPLGSQPIAVHPSSIGVLRPGGDSKARMPRSDSLAGVYVVDGVYVVGGVYSANGAGSRQKGTSRSTRLRRLAARFGTSLVGVGRRFERLDK